MQQNLKIAAVPAFISVCFNASAQQGTKPMVQGGKMESKSEEKIEAKGSQMQDGKLSRRQMDKRKM